MSHLFQRFTVMLLHLRSRLVHHLLPLRTHLLQQLLVLLPCQLQGLLLLTQLLLGLCQALLMALCLQPGPPYFFYLQQCSCCTCSALSGSVSMLLRFGSAKGAKEEDLLSVQKKYKIRGNVLR